MALYHCAVKVRGKVEIERVSASSRSEAQRLAAERHYGARAREVSAVKVSR